MRKRNLWIIAMLTGCCILAGCSNQGTQTDTAQQQEMQGNVIWDSISQLDFTMKSSTWTGAFVQDESNAGDGGDGYANLVIDKDSTWIVTGDSVLTSLTNNGTITDADGKSVTILDTNGKILANGESGYTITVDSLTE